MKKFFTFIAVAAFALSMQASIYIVGNNPFGNWDTANGTEMTDNGDGTYTLKEFIPESIWFVFATGLTEESADWDTFNTQYRYGPDNGGGDETVNVNEWMTTQPSGDGAYMLIVPEGGAEYTFTFDEFTLQFMVEGEKGDDGFNSFTVAGIPAEVFGTTWDPSNTENDMTYDEESGLWKLDKFGCPLQEGMISFKVTANHGWAFSWPAENYDYAIETPGYYDVHFTFDSATYEVNVLAELRGEIPVEPARTDDLYILGEVNGNGWAPNLGVAMETEDKNIYTAEVTATGANTTEGDETAYSYFSFTSKLAETPDDWGSIDRNRLGAITGDYMISEDLLGTELSLSGFGHSESFKIPSGYKYIFTVNLDDMTLNVTKKNSGVGEIVNNKIVAGERYFNVMGQEMSDVNGVTIVVTRYTDGTTSVAKVIK